MIKDKKKFFIWFIFLLGLNRSEARFATIDDISFKYDYYNITANVNPDGSLEQTVEWQATILKEQARSTFAGFYLNYNEDSEQIAILEAATINDNQKQLISDKEMEDKPLASSLNGFDQQRQILLSFPNLEINSKVYLKFTFKKIKPVIDKVFSFRMYDSNYLEKVKFKLNSALPLHIKVNDPNNSLVILKDSEDNFHSLEISNIKPIHHMIVEEPENVVLNDKYGTWVSLSSVASWEELAMKFADKYSQVVSQPLPNVFKQIKQVASDKNTDIDKINTVTSLLNEKVQYMGDWRSIHGQFFPRDLEKIASSQVADCKDFSVSTAAILNQMGYQATVAIVLRGVNSLSPDTLPDYHNFNHAMLKVIANGKDVYWIDPTNTVSMAQGIFSDIASKQALVLDPKTPAYEKITDISPEHSKIMITDEVNLQNNVVSHLGKIDCLGEQALFFTGLGLYLSPQQIQNQIFYILSGSYLEEDPNKYLKLPDLTDRVVKDLNFQYKFEKKNQLINTNLGKGISFHTYPVIDKIIDSNLNQVTDLFIGSPTTSTKRIIIKNINIKKIKDLNYIIDTPWLYFKRECVNRKNNAEILDTIIVKKIFIDNESLKSPLYQKLKNDLDKLVKGAVLIINN